MRTKKDPPTAMARTSAMAPRIFVWSLTRAPPPHPTQRSGLVVSLEKPGQVASPGSGNKPASTRASEGITKGFWIMPTTPSCPISGGRGRDSAATRRMIRGRRLWQRSTNPPSPTLEFTSAIRRSTDHSRRSASASSPEATERASWQCLSRKWTRDQRIQGSLSSTRHLPHCPGGTAILQAETQTGASLSALPPCNDRPCGDSPQSTRCSEPHRPRSSTGTAHSGFCAQTHSGRLSAPETAGHPCHSSRGADRRGQSPGLVGQVGLRQACDAPIEGAGCALADASAQPRNPLQKVFLEQPPLEVPQSSNLVEVFLIPGLCLSPAEEFHAGQLQPNVVRQILEVFRDGGARLPVQLLHRQR